MHTVCVCVFVFKQKAAYEMPISDWSSDACSSDLRAAGEGDPSRRGAPLTEATAYLSFATRENGGHPLLVTVDRGTDRDRVGLRTAITAATPAPGVTAPGIDAPVPAETTDVSIRHAARRVGQQ